MSTLFQFGRVGYVEKQTLEHRALLSLTLLLDVAKRGPDLGLHTSCLWLYPSHRQSVHGAKGLCPFGEHAPALDHSSGT